ncbi:hypothetical protein C2S52_013689 [Perilla frutescens var. hirtella]|nr:hypothetical protein C2S51_015970 [Perilla frutescens var. frutescens]KAH6776128.1 hypothetical protein C2S52_013689 [Perilla frutescens var. hirtella]
MTTTLLFSGTPTTVVSASSPARINGSRQVFDSRPDHQNELGSEKRRVPTGSNPLHNK